MSFRQARIPAVPWFLPAPGGQRFCLYHAPADGTRPRGAVLYVHPFGDEMNRARRMAALQARAFADAGIAVLQIDLYGCGDSSGDFADARWELWHEDLTLAHAWLARRTGAPVSLWGLRLGALLAMDYARGAALALHSAILWQPVLSGRTFLTQFLRLRLAGDLLSIPRNDAGRETTEGLRARLTQGEALEVAGYELAPALALAIDAAALTVLPPPSQPVAWFEVVADATRPPAPAGTQLAAKWRAGGTALQAQTVAGMPFWATPDITECAGLLAPTVAACGGRGAYHEYQ